VPVTIPIFWDAGTFVGRGAGMRFTTAFLARGFQALALAFAAGFDFAALVRLGVRPRNGENAEIGTFSVS